jgi:hypothetical protein
MSVELNNLFDSKPVCDLRIIDRKLSENRKVEWEKLIVLKPKLRT